MTRPAAAHTGNPGFERVVSAVGRYAPPGTSAQEVAEAANNLVGLVRTALEIRRRMDHDAAHGVIS